MLSKGFLLPFGLAYGGSIQDEWFMYGATHVFPGNGANNIDEEPISVTSPEECATKCHEEPGCEGFVMVGGTDCYRKTEIDLAWRSKQQGYTTYIKKASIPVIQSFLYWGQCLALPQSDVGDGNLLRTADCDVEANDNQRWQFSGGQLVYAAEPSRCVDLRYDGRPQIWECTGAPQQQMQHNPDERTITFSSPHRCLGVGVNGVRPRSFACDGDARLLWVVSNDEEMPAPAPPSPPPPSGAGYQCDVCFHVYDAEQDGGGLAFEDLPEDWTCPICAQPKSHYKMVQPETTAAPAPASQFKCTVCAHVYDPASDGNGLAFEELPDDWTCPVCAQPKSAYEPVAPAPAPATQFKCSICAHVYDPASDGNGLAFEELPDDWTCPVCAQPKSAYQPVAPAPAPASQFKCSICAHIYDPVSDGNGLAFEELPDDWTCPVCAQPKSAYAPVAGTALVAQKQTMQPISV